MFVDFSNVVSKIINGIKAIIKIFKSLDPLVSLLNAEIVKIVSIVKNIRVLNNPNSMIALKIVE